jgi:hypothetical protein
MRPSNQALIATLAGAVASAASVVVQQQVRLYEPTGLNDRDSDVGKGRRWLSDCLDDDRQLFVETRLRRPIFDDLVQRLRHYVSNHIVSTGEKVLIFLYICGQGASWRNTRYKCGRSLATITSLVPYKACRFV